MQILHNCGMTLDEFLRRQPETDAAFGVKVGLSQSQISRLRRGVAKPSWGAMKAISDATNGKVDFKDWARLREAAQ
jgi:hypothetical protein